jgi:hypothetical protein
MNFPTKKFDLDKKICLIMLSFAASYFFPVPVSIIDAIDSGDFLNDAISIRYRYAIDLKLYRCLSVAHIFYGHSLIRRYFTLVRTSEFKLLAIIEMLIL